MTSPTRAFAIAALSLLALFLLQPASARSDLLPYTVTTNTADTNGDGVTDPSVVVSGGMVCGCYCPVTTTTLHIEAVGQQVDYREVKGGCYTYEGASATSGEVDPTATPTYSYSSTCSGPCPE